MPFETPVDESELPISAVNVCSSLGVKTLGDLTKLSVVDFIAAERSTHTVVRALVQEVCDLLSEQDFENFLERSATRPLPQPTKTPAVSGGCLYIRVPEATTAVVDRIHELVVAAYAANGCSAASLDDWEPDEEFEPTLREAFGADVVLITPTHPLWVAVQSYAFERTPAARHPLAMALSKHFVVLNIENAAHEGTRVELYSGGSCTGISPQTDGFAPLDLASLKATVPTLLEPLLDAYLTDGDRLMTVLDVQHRGFRDTAESMPLDGFSERNICVFARNA